MSRCGNYVSLFIDISLEYGLRTYSPVDPCEQYPNTPNFAVASPARLTLANEISFTTGAEISTTMVRIMAMKRIADPI